MTMILGVDPGKSGAIALLDSNGELIMVEDMPVTDKHVSTHLLADIIGSHADAAAILGETLICVIENVWSSPQMGVTSAFSFGRSKGLVEMAAAAFGCRIVMVSPAKWKKDMKLNKDKGIARKTAMDRWPKHSHTFKRVKDDGRAEAALIGLWQVNHGE
jgi:crossover junction endodeoxyribonuclease RuvC